LDEEVLSLAFAFNGRGPNRGEARKGAAPSIVGWRRHSDRRVCYSGFAPDAGKREGVYAVMPSHDEEHIVTALTWNLHPADEERLCVDFTIYMQVEELTQLLSIYIAQRGELARFPPVSERSHMTRSILAKVGCTLLFSKHRSCL
jgi:hypothetical protein